MKQQNQNLRSKKTKIEIWKNVPTITPSLAKSQTLAVRMYLQSQMPAWRTDLTQGEGGNPQLGRLRVWWGHNLHRGIHKCILGFICKSLIPQKHLNGFCETKKTQTIPEHVYLVYLYCIQHVYFIGMSKYAFICIHICTIHRSHSPRCPITNTLSQPLEAHPGTQGTIWCLTETPQGFNVPAI